MIDPDLRAALAAFDEAALATLANPGLVRRARRDVDEGKVRLTACRDGKAELEADGQAVTLDARGPRAADCACRSVALCRHRIAAVLFLQSSSDDLGDIAAEQEEGDPREIVGALALDRLERWAGKASWRAALELVDAASDVAVTFNAVSVSFPDVEGPVRILRGQGLDGIVSKASKARVKAYHAAAVLAARRHFGADMPAPGEEREEEAVGAIEIDPAFLDRVSSGLGEVAALGMNLAPLPLEESLFALSVSSRADSLPRLAALLRAIVAQIRLRRLRALDFDPDRLLELAATAHALTRALARGDDGRRVTLAGKLRRDFVAAEPLHLIGCGGERWQTSTGARGVTAWFIEPATGRWLSTSLARGAGQDPTFSPGEAWRGQPLWQAEPLAVLAHARIDLAGSRRSADDRISAPAGAKAVIVARDMRPDPHWPGVVRDWGDLRNTWLEQTGLGLDSTEIAAACLIAPSGMAPPYFDDLAQQLVWPLRDANGQWLAATLDHAEPVATAIEALEAHVRSGWDGMVLVRVLRAGDRLEIRPVTLFGRNADPVDLTLWRRPWGRESAGTAVRDWLARLRPGASRRFVQAWRGDTEAALANAWRHLLDRAEVGPALARSLDAERDAHAARLDSFGLPRLAALLRDGGNGHGLLAAAYGLLLARQQRCVVPLLQ